MKLKGYKHKLSGRIAISRYRQWSIIGTPLLKKEYIYPGNLFRFCRDTASAIPHSEWEEIDLLDYEKEIMPHLTKDANVRPIHFKKARVSRELVNVHGLDEKRVTEALMNRCESIEEVVAYLLKRGYKPARNILNK